MFRDCGPLRLRSWDVTTPDRPVELWNRQLPSGRRYANFAFRPDGAMFAILEDSGKLRLWRVDRHRLCDEPASSVTVGDLGGSIAFQS